jgi:hypothetical protein
VAFTASAIFREWPIQMFQVSGTGYTGLDSDTVKLANFGNTGTPDKDAAVGLTGYAAAASAWVTGNEVIDTSGGGNWPAGGLALASKTFTTPATGVAMFDAADRAGTGNVTLAGVFGGLVYDDTITAGSVADQGVCFNYYGGTQSVTSGTFTVIFNVNGVCRFTT